MQLSAALLQEDSTGDAWGLTPEFMTFCLEPFTFDLEPLTFILWPFAWHLKPDAQRLFELD